MRRYDDEANTLTVRLGFTPAYRTLAARRAELWGTTPGEPAQTEVD